MGNSKKTSQGGYSQDQLKKNISIHKEFNPTGRFTFLDYIAWQAISQMDGKPANDAIGEENEYWKAYLGLSNNVPKYSDQQNAQWEKETNTDRHIERDYYTTTPRMDQDIQALADTMNLNRIVTNYDELNKTYKFDRSKEYYEKLLKQARTVLESPNQWVQIQGSLTGVRNNDDEDVVNENNPLGMLNNFGLMWNPETQKLYMHDTYDFPKRVTIMSTIPQRPVEMKIRSAINYDPNKGSVVFRSPVNYNKQPKSIAK